MDLKRIESSPYTKAQITVGSDEFDKPYLGAGLDRIIDLRMDEVGEAVRDMIANSLWDKTYGP